MAKKLCDCLEDVERDVIYFFCLCTKQDAKLFISDPMEKTIEDFGRFFCLGLALNMKGMFLNVLAQYEVVGDVENLLDFIKAVTFEQIKKWVDEFLEKIDNQTLKECAQSIWQEKEMRLTDGGFKLSELL